MLYHRPLHRPHISLYNTSRICAGAKAALQKSIWAPAGSANAQMRLPEQEVKKEKEQVPPMGIAHSNALPL